MANVVRNMDREPTWDNTLVHISLTWAEAQAIVREWKYVPVGWDSQDELDRLVNEIEKVLNEAK